MPYGQAAANMPAVPHHGVWPEIIREAVHLATVNWEAKLSAQDRFSQIPFNDSCIVLTRAARDPAHHPAIMPCAEALLWASGNDFTWIGVSLAERAATTCVSLLGRNEGGLTLDKKTVDCVTQSVHRCFDTSPTADWMTKLAVRYPASKVASRVQFMVNMVIADSSK